MSKSTKLLRFIAGFPEYANNISIVTICGENHTEPIDQLKGWFGQEISCSGEIQNGELLGLYVDNDEFDIQQIKQMIEIPDLVILEMDQNITIFCWYI